MKWPEYFIQKAELTARKSKDPSTKTGVILVGEDLVELTSGFNGFPRGVRDRPDRYANRKRKYQLIAHAETNAIYNAARYGIRLKDSHMYTSFGTCTCQECAKAIIQAGIISLTGRNLKNDFAEGRWKDSIKIGIEMLKEACIILYEWNGESLEVV